MPIVLLNQEGLAEDFQDQKAADQALQSGSHLVPLVGPDGSPVGVPGTERAAKLAEGYLLPTSDQLQSLLDTSKYGTTGQAVIAGLEGAAETATLGASGAIESALGVSPEAQLKRSEQNPTAHAVGEAVGVVAPMLVGDELGALNVLGKVGSAAEKGAAKLAGDGLKSKLAGWAGRGAAETALMEGEHVLNEAMLGDPNVTAEHALADVGVSALIGGAVGPIVGKLAEGGGELTSKLFGKAEELKEGLSKLKPNAPEIEAAATRLGVTPLPGQLSASKTVQDLQSQITKELTVVGTREQALVDQQFDAIRQGTTEAFGSPTPMTKMEAGEMLQQQLAARIEAEKAPIEEMYSRLKAQVADVPLGEEVTTQAVTDPLMPSHLGKTTTKFESAALDEAKASLRSIDGINLKTGRFPEDRLVRNTLSDVKELRTVEQLREYKSKVQRAAAGDPTLRHTAGAINQILGDLEERAIVEFAARAGFDVDAVLGERMLAKDSYKALIGKLEELGDKIGKRRIYGPQDFLNHLQDMGGEKLIDRLFAKGDGKFLQWFRGHFPAEADVLSSYHRSALAERAMKDGLVQPGVALREIDKLSPEARKFLFPQEAIQKLDDAKTLLDSMPKDINPSGTAKSQSWREALNPVHHLPAALAGELAGGPLGGLAGVVVGMAGPQVSSYLKRGLIRSLVSGRPEEVARHGVMSALADRAARTAKATSTAAKAIFSRSAAERVRHTSDERDKHMKKLTELSQDPQKFVDRLSKMTEGMTDHAPQTATALSSAAGRAVQFLASKVPQELQVSPFSKPVQPSELAKAKFQRYAEAVMNPVGVMSRISDGTMSVQDVEALQAVYPQLYQSMRDHVMSSMADAVTKKTEVPYTTRLGLSMFLGTPVDHTIAPHAVLSAQESFARQSTPEPGPAKGGAPHSTKSLMKQAEQSLTSEQAAATRRSTVS